MLKMGDKVKYLGKEYLIMSINGDFVSLNKDGGSVAKSLLKEEDIISSPKSIKDLSDDELMDIIRDARQEKFGQGKVSRKARKDRKPSKGSSRVFTPIES